MGKQAKLYHAARAEARRHADDNPPPHMDSGDALQWIVDRVADQLKYAATKVDALPEDNLEVMTPFGPMPNEWVRAEERLRTELMSVCVNVERVGLAERMVRVQEARAALLLQAIINACREVGIPRQKVKELGPALRAQLSLVEEQAA